MMRLIIKSSSLFLKKRLPTHKSFLDFQQVGWTKSGPFRTRNHFAMKCVAWNCQIRCVCVCTVVSTHRETCLCLPLTLTAAVYKFCSFSDHSLLCCITHETLKCLHWLLFWYLKICFKERIIAAGRTVKSVCQVTPWFTDTWSICILNSSRWRKINNPEKNILVPHHSVWVLICWAIQKRYLVAKWLSVYQ